MKTIPLALATSKASSSSTLCLLRKIGPLPDGTYRYQCSLDADVVYDDGTGSATYKARIGYEASALVSSADLGVDNAEGQMFAPLVTHQLEGITKEQVEAGYLDKVPFVVYEVDYENLAAGHEIRNGGTLGEAKWKYNESVLIPEERSLSQQLKQTVGRIYSLTCPAKFGSQPIGTGGGVVEERKPCGKDVSSLWVSLTVTAVDSDEPDLVFSDSTLTQDDDYFKHGVVTCTGGSNLGQTREIESFGSGQFVLRFPFTQPVAVADTFDARPGCSKLHKGDNSCRTWFGEEWVDHFRGMPHMPVAEATKLLVPGAGLTGRYSGTGEETNISTPPTDSGGTPPQTGDTDPGTTRTRGATIVTVSSTYGDGATDATAAINAAIASLPGDGGTVVIPDGTYLIDPTVSVLPVSNMWLKLSAGTILKAKYTALDHKYVVWISGKSNVDISGGTIQGYRPLWSPIVGTTSEWGHCISCGNSTAVTIRDITLKDAVGDGMSIGGGCDDVILDNVLTDNNRRQGLSIVAGTNITVTDSTFRNTHGTSPECGIDIEPESGDVCQHITIQNCKFETNAKYGINILKRSGVTATLDDITVTGCTIGGSVSAGNLSNGIVANTASNVTFSNNTISYNSATGLRCSSVTNLTISGNTFAHNYTRNGIDNTDTAHLLASGLNSPATDPHVLIPTPASGQSITNNTFYY
jgi:uncharacterized phage protein (TIGR02218 family)